MHIHQITAINLF